MSHEAAVARVVARGSTAEAAAEAEGDFGPGAPYAAVVGAAGAGCPLSARFPRHLPGRFEECTCTPPPNMIADAAAAAYRETAQASGADTRDIEVWTDAMYAVAYAIAVYNSDLDGGNGMGEADVIAAADEVICYALQK